ncbi:hypothetical protein [Kutzneria chonburiensis]|uniref:Uncharacterized protein n=1 Tax=Kutzneria chonburiensis TaxID=1483604 RepID=A0ABV6MK33_9PSEU|nr:hypothetical protein [Kutzneria chonburiensis]
MSNDMIAMLRTLTKHVDRNGLADSIVSVRISFGEFDLSVKDYEVGMAVILGRWADLLGEVTITAKPSSGGYDYVHVKLAGRIDDYPANVTWVASGEQAAGLRRLLGLAEQPAYPLDLAALADLPAAA